jgi:flagellin
VAQQVRGGQGTFLRVVRLLNEQPTQVRQGIQRLSSGKRVLDSSDDIGSVTESATLSIQSRGLRKGVENLSEAIQATAMGEDAIGNLYSIASKIYDLAGQVAYTNVTSTQTSAMQTEANALVTEYNRIVQGTSYNGNSLLASASNVLAVSDGALSSRSINVKFGEIMPAGATASSVTLSTSVGLVTALSWSYTQQEAAQAQIDAIEGYMTRLEVGAISTQFMQTVNEDSADRLLSADQATEVAELLRVSIRQQSVRAIAGSGSDAARWLSTLMNTIQQAKEEEEKQKQEAPEPV